MENLVLKWLENKGLVFRVSVSSGNPAGQTAMFQTAQKGVCLRILVLLHFFIFFHQFQKLMFFLSFVF